MGDALHRSLLVVSGSIPPDLDDEIMAGRRPRADYRVIAERLGAEVADVAAARSATGRLGRLAHRLGGVGLLMAWYCFVRRRDFSLIVTDGEHVGLPFAALCRVLGRRGVRHAMIVHVASTRAKRLLTRFFGLGPLIDHWIVYCTWQRDFVRDSLAVPADRVALTPFMVDTRFFSPSQADVRPARKICAVGLERRDYSTLIDAVDGLDVEVVIAAASPWSRQKDSTERVVLPPNVTVQSFSQAELRPLYASSMCSVVPLEDVDFQAGITAILESMAMARPVVCSATLGQNDTVDDGVTGRYVPVGDAEALRAVITELLDAPEACARMGVNARAWAVEHADIEVYADRLASIVLAPSARTGT